MAGAKNTEEESVLKTFAQNMTELAAAGKYDPVIGRDEEIRRVIRILARRTKNNPCLIGEPGVGKTALVEGLAQRILNGDVPASLKCTLFSLDVAGLVAGASFRGQFEQRLKDLLKEVKKYEGGVILFVDEAHLLMGAGKADGAMDAANILKPMLARGELRLICATTLNEYREYIEKDAAFERRLQQVFVGEPSVSDTVSILRGLKDRYEVHHGVRFTDSALVAAATLSKRYINDRFLPDKAVDLLDETGANFRVQLDSQPEAIDELERKALQLEVEQTALKKDANKDAGSKQRLRSVQAELQKIKEELEPLKAQFAEERGNLDKMGELKSKLDNLRMKLEEAERTRDMALAADLKFYAIPEVVEQVQKLQHEMDIEAANQPEKMLSDVIGQDAIAQTVARWTGIPVNKIAQTEASRLLSLASDLKRRVFGQDEAVELVANSILRSRAGLARPNGPSSFLFLGSTGTGKTELAKAVANELFDDESALLRIDMSEYMEQHSVARLIGSPPGYVGHETGGQLTEAVRRRPYQVILFDEIEKAHRDVTNVLLQVLDDGILTDGRGRKVSFSNTLCVLTSNVGSQHLLGDNYFSFEQGKTLVLEELRRQFRPEFLNRLDETVVFRPLSTNDLKAITRRLVEEGVGERLVDRNIRIDIDEAAISYMLAQSYDPAYGARPLRRFIERTLATEISRQLVSGELQNNSRIVIRAMDNQLKTISVSLKRDMDTD